jgi:hypothetical protein
MLAMNTKTTAAEKFPISATVHSSEFGTEQGHDSVQDKICDTKICQQT